MQNSKYMITKQPFKINIFCDSQTAINKLRVIDNKENQSLKAWIYQKTKQPVQQRHQILICGVSSHCNIEGNKKVDLAAKKVARRQKVHTIKWTSLTHLKRRIIDEKKIKLSPWHSQMTKKCKAQINNFYFSSFKRQIDSSLARLTSFTHYNSTNSKRDIMQ